MTSKDKDCAPQIPLFFLHYISPLHHYLDLLSHTSLTIEHNI